MAKYHMSNGVARPCKAKEGNCPIKGSDGSPAQHFGTKEEAYKDFEQKQSEIAPITKISSPNPNLPENAVGWKNLKQGMKFYEPNDPDQKPMTVKEVGHDFVKTEEGKTLYFRKNKTAGTVRLVEN